MRASRLIDNLTEKWTIDSSFISAGKFFLYNALCAHLLACFFFMIPTLFSCDENHKSRCVQRSGRPIFSFVFLCCTLSI